MKEKQVKMEAQKTENVEIEKLDAPTPNSEKAEEEEDINSKTTLDITDVRCFASSFEDTVSTQSYEIAYIGLYCKYLWQQDHYMTNEVLMWFLYLHIVPGSDVIITDTECYMTAYL